MRWPCVRGSVTLMAAIIWATPAASQRVVVDSGQRVRVRAEGLPSGWSDALMQSVIGDTVVVMLARDGSRVSLPLASIEKLEIWRRRSPNTRTGALIGGAILGSAGAVWCGYSYCDESRGVVFLGGAAVGALLGAGVGSTIRSDRWEAVAPGALISPTPGGLTVGLRLRL